MSRVDWLIERASRIEARIREEESANTRISRRPGDRRARREALLVIRRRIAELEGRGATLPLANLSAMDAQ